MNKDYVLNFAKELLHIDSPSGYTKAAIDFVEKEVTALGYETKRSAKGNLLVYVKGQSSEKTIGFCGRCMGACNYDAIYNENDSANDDLNKKIAEYSKAVVDGRPNFHINLVIDISPYCDCHAENDAPILPDVGMFASFDPVALDQACADACNAQTPMPNSLLNDHMHEEGFHDHHDHFTNTTPETNWKVCLEHAEKIGLGTREYELIEVK